MYTDLGENLDRNLDSSIPDELAGTLDRNSGYGELVETGNWFERHKIQLVSGSNLLQLLGGGKDGVVLGPGSGVKGNLQISDISALK